MTTRDKVKEEKVDKMKSISSANFAQHKTKPLEKKIEKLNIIEVGDNMSSSSLVEGMERLITSIIPESNADKKLADKINEIIERLNHEK